MNAEERAAEAAARGDLAGERYWLGIARIVDEAPPLSPEQISKLRVLIWSDAEAPSKAA